MARIANPLIRGFESHPVLHYIAKIAQLVEHLFEAQGVGGSIPSLGTRECPFSLMVKRLFCNQLMAVRFCHGAPSFPDARQVKA